MRRGKGEVANVRGEPGACRAVSGAQPRVVGLTRRDDVFDVGLGGRGEAGASPTFSLLTAVALLAVPLVAGAEILVEVGHNRLEPAAITIKSGDTSFRAHATVPRSD